MDRPADRHRGGAAVAAFITRAVMQPRVAGIQSPPLSRKSPKTPGSRAEAENILRTSREAAQDIRLEAEKAIERRYQDLARAEERVDRRGANQDTQAKPSNNANNCSISARADWTSARTIWATPEQEHRQKLEETAL